MKTIPDVMRYLERNANPALGRENFTFNTKVNVGNFFESRQGEPEPVQMTESEVLARIEQSRGKRARRRLLAAQKREKAAKEQALARQVMESKMKRRMELEGGCIIHGMICSCIVTIALMVICLSSSQ